MEEHGVHRDDKENGVGQRTFPMYTVDAFTSVPFEGNPAAVCLDQVNYQIRPPIPP